MNNKFGKLAPHNFFIFFFTFFFCAELKSQFKEADQVQFKETLDWLASRLTYTYYNPQTNEYWSNRFFYNLADKTISIRNVSTAKPNASKKNKVLDRTVKIHHLNSSSITISNVDEHKGRMVEGKEIKIRTIGNTREIKRSFNGRTSLKEFVLDIPIPQYYEDSINSLSISIQQKFIKAIEQASKVYPSEHLLDNVNIILDIFSGSFQGSNGSVRSYKGILHTAIEADEMINQSFVEKEIIGYNEKDDTFFRWTIHEHDVSVMKLNIDTNGKISLFSDDKKYQLTIYGLNNFTIVNDGIVTDYHRVSYD